MFNFRCCVHAALRTTHLTLRLTVFRFSHPIITHLLVNNGKLTTNVFSSLFYYYAFKSIANMSELNTLIALSNGVSID